MSGSSIIYYYYTVVLELVGITDTTVQTGIGAGLSMWTWVIQIAAVFVGKRVGKKTILLWIWPLLLVSLAGLCATSGVFANSANGNTSAGIGACVAFTRAKRPALIADSCLTPCSVALVWIYLGFFNFASAPPSFRFQPLERSLISTCVSPSRPAYPHRPGPLFLCAQFTSASSRPRTRLTRFPRLLDRPRRDSDILAPQQGPARLEHGQPVPRRLLHLRRRNRPRQDRCVLSSTIHTKCFCQTEREADLPAVLHSPLSYRLQVLRRLHAARRHPVAARLPLCVCFRLPGGFHLLTDLIKPPGTSPDMVETHSFTLEEIAQAFGSEQIVVPRLDRLAREQAGVVERTRVSDEESKKSVDERR
jgi:hypothetical protein